MRLDSNTVEDVNSFRSKRSRLRTLSASVLTILAMSFVFSAEASDTPSSITLLDARERGISNVGSAKGTLTPTFDESVNKDVLELSYNLSKGSSIRVWTKNFPPALKQDSVNTARMGVRVQNSSQANQISVTVEMEGPQGVQSIPLRLKPGWNSVQKPVDWKKIGDLAEVRFLISATGEVDSVKGALSMSLDFVKQAPAQTASTSVKALSPRKPQEAPRRGTILSGSAKANVIPTYDEVSDKDVLELDYTLPKGSAVHVWTKEFSGELSEASANKVRIGVRLQDSGQAGQISIKVEMRGTKGIQNIPLHLKPGWNSVGESIDWKGIGHLDEVRFVINPAAAGSSDVVKGTLSLSLDFVKQAFSPGAKVPGQVPSLYSLLDAGEKGVFNMGPSQGTVRTEFDESAGKDVWKFDYSVPLGSVIGVWSKSYHRDLNSQGVDAVTIGVKVPDTSQLNEASVKVEIKGINGMQTIPLVLKAGRNSFRDSIQWGKIGDLTEVVFVVSPMGQNKPASGALYFDLDFGKLSFFERNFTFIKAGLVLVLSLFLALMAALLGRLLGEKRALQETSILKKIPQDLFCGTVAVLIGSVALVIYSLGARNPLDAGFSLGFLAVGLAGLAIAELLKSRLTGKHLTAREVFQNIFITGLLAASSARQELLAAPGSWMQVLMLNHFLAALAFLIYHITNASSLASSGKHLKPVTAALIVGTPYLFNWLPLAESITLLESLANGITFGLFARWPLVLELIGRFLIVLGFNEAVTAGISLATQRKLLKTPRAHGFILLVSLGVVIAPLIADLGSTAVIASFPLGIKALIAILTTMLSFAGLWGEVYLITGMLLDGGHRRAPSWESLSKHVMTGMKKGMAYSGILVAILYALYLIVFTPAFQKIMAALPIVIGTLAGAGIFPLIKTIMETFDGSIPFFERTRHSYRNATLYARGALVGFGFAYMVTHGMFQEVMSNRVIFGLVIGLLASGGVSVLRDVVYAVRKQGRIQTWRLYFTDSLLGAFIGSAAAFYLDALQVPVIVEKFKLYTSSGLAPLDYITYPLVNKWGRVDLGSYTGGVKLLYLESLAGVINWSIAAWLFAINKVFLQAFFEKQSAPIKFFFSKAGFAQLVEHMIYVLRWGLWMAPIIFTFLRMMPNPTWYNQDGAIRTLFAIYNNVTMTPEAFQAWSLQLFVYVLAIDFFRVLIWMDHMGLRVATLVNLSFIGLDRLDERIARFIGPAATQRYIPDAVKRFATWAPLLIPFYLPRGEAWDYAWTTSEAMQNAARGKGILFALQSLTFLQMVVIIGLAILLGTALSFVIRTLARRSRQKRIRSYELANREYKVVLKENGEAYSQVDHKKSDVYPPEYDISRRSYDIIDPSGRILFLADASESPRNKACYWPVLGNFPHEKFTASRMERGEDSLRVTNTSNGIRTTIEISLPDEDTAAELWKITVENLTERSRQLKVVPYMEWVLNGGLHDRFHTQYARLFPEMEYVSEANAILAWQKSTKVMGILAADIPPQGFMTSRMDFIGRARSIWAPRILETLDFLEVRDTAGYPTFDPIGSLKLDLALDPKASRTMRLMIGYAKNKKSALGLIKKHLKPSPLPLSLTEREGSLPAGQAGVRVKFPLIGHGEIPPGTPQPYSEFIDEGRKLLVRTPFTPRPYDHAVSNEVHSVMVTNRGLHTSCNGNSQQNRLTPDWPDMVTKEIPTEAIYLYDPDQGEWFSPTYHPLNKQSAKYESEFGVDGTAVFRMTDGSVSTELTVFVPPKDPTGVYLLTVKNHANHSRRMRIAPYFQMVLAFQPERSGELRMRHDKASGALFIANPRNEFRLGPAFVAMTLAAERVETRRGRFFGAGRGIEHPFLVEKGEPDTTQHTDTSQIAGLLGTVEIPAHGECTVAVILGQADTWDEARRIVKKYQSIESVRESLESTRGWWLSLMGTVEVKTNHPEFDYYQNWLKYQAIAERIWARRGFYQTSGAYGFRDQLQDTVNLIWVDPALARKQIILHASHQFFEGDVYHWFFTRTDGRTAFACRSHASDNPVWLVWGVVEYIQATGDDSILDEMASYVSAQFPFAPLPRNKQGWGHLYHRSTRADSVYGHCLTSLDLVLEKRMGKHGLPLIGTGDWNDGLDEIGSEGKGESIWLGFFVYYILKHMLDIIEKKEGRSRKEHYLKKMKALEAALERTWRRDRYLRAFHDDGTEIGVKGSGIWEIDALTAAWAVMSGINFERGLTLFNTALSVLEKENAILLGWPALREDTKPYLGRSSKYPEGVRENGMYCHGVQWLVKAARILAEQFAKRGDSAKADEYRRTAYRLWLKISPLSHVTPEEIEIYGGQPNKQAADILTNFDQGRMIWHGYTGAAGWMLRQAYEGVVGASLIRNELVLPEDLDKPRGELIVHRVHRDVGKSPLETDGKVRKNGGQSLPADLSSKSKVTIVPPEVTVEVKSFREPST